MLHLNELTHRYGPIKAVDSLSLHVRKGEILGLLGANGAGKSTLVNLVAGLLKPDSGQVQLSDNGHESPLSFRRQIGVAPQSIALYMDLSARENLVFLGRLYGLKGAVLRKRVAWAVAFVGLSNRQDDRLSTYSGGMKRRINLAAAVLHQPKLLLLDEPTVGVDPQSRNAILEQVLALKAQGCTIIYTSHYMEEVEQIADRVAIMDHGKLIALGSVAEILAEHGGGHKVIATGEAGEEAFSMVEPTKALRALARVPGLRDFRTVQPSLETVFLNLTGRDLRDP